MAYMIGMVVGAVAGIFLLSRLALLVLKFLGDRPLRIVIAHLATFAIAVSVGGIGLANGGPPLFLAAAVIYGLPVLLWLAVDLFAWKGRTTKAREEPSS